MSLHPQLGLELPVGGLFEIELQPFEALALGIVRAGSALAQTSSQHQRGVWIVRLAVEGCAKAFRRRLELPALPQRVTDIEMIVGIGVVSVEGFFEILQSLQR